jgi:hypothetical protein
MANDDGGTVETKKDDTRDEALACIAEQYGYTTSQLNEQQHQNAYESQCRRMFEEDELCEREIRTWKPGMTFDNTYQWSKEPADPTEVPEGYTVSEDDPDWTAGRDQLWWHKITGGRLWFLNRLTKTCHLFPGVEHYLTSFRNHRSSDDRPQLTTEYYARKARRQQLLQAYAVPVESPDEQKKETMNESSVVQQKD